MSSLVLGAVGAVAGFFVGGPVGAAVGFGLGAALGASLNMPPGSIEAGKLGDLKASAGSYGSTIPYIQGTMRVPGVFIWNSDKRETKTTTSQGGGKGGGPSVETTTYTYSMDVLFLLSSGPIVGVRRVWSNGKLVWTVHENSSDEDVLAGDDGTHWDRMTVYTGAADQTPDPTYEAAVGTLNACAYRGRGSVFIENLQLGGGGQVPQLTFEVFTDGIAVGGAQSSYAEDFSSFPTGWVAATSDTGGGVGAFSGGTGPYGPYIQIPKPTATERHIIRKFVATMDPVWKWSFYFKIIGPEDIDDAGNLSIGPNSDGFGFFTYFIPMRETFYDSSRRPRFGASTYGGEYILNEPGGGFKLNVDQWYYAELELVDVPNGTVWCHVWDASLGTFTTANYTLRHIGSYVELEGVTGYPDKEAVWASIDTDPDCMSTLYADMRINGDLATRATVNMVPLSEVVADQCQRAGLTASEYDVSDLAATSVRGFAVTNVAPARSVLEMLASAYHFDCYESGGRIVFRMRGDDPVLTLAFDDLGASENGDAEALALTRINDVEIPTQFSVKYANYSNDYQDGVETSDRLISANSLKVETVELSMALTPGEARQVAEVRSNQVQMSNLIVESVGTDLATGCEIEPSDTIVVVDQDGTQYTLKVQKVTRSGFLQVLLECSLEDVTAVIGTALADENYVDSTTVLPKSGSTLYVLDIPLLRDADDGYNHYYAVGRTDIAGTWVGAAISRGPSADTLLAVDEAYSYTYTGTTVNVLGDFTRGTVFDETNRLVVTGGGVLESYTRDEILNGTAPALLVGDEVIYYMTATPFESPTISPSTVGSYVLTGLLRGRRGTEWAISGHVAGESVVLLQPTAGVKLYSDGAVSDIGVAYVWGSVTLGTAEAVATQSFTNNGVMQKPFAPVDVRSSVDSTSSPNTITLTWKRRTRYAVQFTGATGSVVPLGEDSESYEIDLNDPGSPTDPTVTVTATSPTKDLDISYSGWTATIYQISAQHGRGYGVTYLIP